MELAVAEGMIPLQQDGINKAAAGVTTLAEVLQWQDEAVYLSGG